MQDSSEALSRDIAHLSRRRGTWSGAPPCPATPCPMPCRHRVDARSPRPCACAVRARARARVPCVLGCGTRVPCGARVPPAHIGDFDDAQLVLRDEQGVREQPVRKVGLDVDVEPLREPLVSHDTFGVSHDAPQICNAGTRRRRRAFSRFKNFSLKSLASLFNLQLFTSVSTKECLRTASL